MSDTDSFIDEVTEEVRREKLFKMVRRYGWIAVLLVVVLVGGATWNELRKASDRDEAQAFGDAILTALSNDERIDRAAALAELEAPTSEGDAMLSLLTAAELGADSPSEAAEQLLTLADRADIPEVYRHVATLKAVMLPDAELDPADRASRLETLVASGGPIRLLAEEQLAMIDIEAGDAEAAISRLQALYADAEATQGLRERASQLIVALGGELNG